MQCAASGQGRGSLPWTKLERNPCGRALMFRRTGFRAHWRTSDVVSHLGCEGLAALPVRARTSRLGAWLRPIGMNPSRNHMP